MHGATAWRSRYTDSCHVILTVAIRDCERHCHAISTHRCWSPHWRMKLRPRAFRRGLWRNPRRPDDQRLGGRRLFLGAVDQVAHSPDRYGASRRGAAAIRVAARRKRRDAAAIPGRGADGGTSVPSGCAPVMRCICRCAPIWARRFGRCTGGWARRRRMWGCRPWCDERRPDARRVRRLRPARLATSRPDPDTPPTCIATRTVMQQSYHWITPVPPDFAATVDNNGRAHHDVTG